MFLFSGCQCVNRGRFSSEDAILPFVDIQTIRGGKDLVAVSKSMQCDAEQDLHISLQETLSHFSREYPRDDVASIRKRTDTELSDYLECADVPLESVAAQGNGEAIASLPPTSHFVGTSGSSPSKFVNHAELTQSMYEAHGIKFDFEARQSMACEFLRAMGLRTCDSGVRNQDASGETLWNQCFYLSMSRALLGSETTAERISGLALRLRRAIEIAVLAEHPNWQEELRASATGEGQAMVFADFLAVAMRQPDGDDEPNLTSKLAVCVLDSVSGHAEVYLGPNYEPLESRDEQVQNLLTLWYVPGHYQCIVEDNAAGSKVQMTYDEFKARMQKHGVVYIETVE